MKTKSRWGRFAVRVRYVRRATTGQRAGLVRKSGTVTGGGRPAGSLVFVQKPRHDPESDGRPSTREVRQLRATVACSQSHQKQRLAERKAERASHHINLGIKTQDLIEVPLRKR